MDRPIRYQAIVPFAGNSGKLSDLPADMRAPGHSHATSMAKVTREAFCQPGPPSSRVSNQMLAAVRESVHTVALFQAG